MTCFRTWAGFVYFAFILDCYSRLVAGWQISSHLRTELVMDAIEIANGLSRPGAALITHGDSESVGCGWLRAA